MVQQVINRWSYVVDRMCRSAAVGFFLIMLGIMLFQVLARYVFNSVPVWTEDVARYSMIWGGLLGASAAFKSDAEPRLFEPPKEGARWKIITAEYLRGLAVVVFLGPVLYHSHSFIIRNFGRISGSIGIPMGFVVLAVPLSILVILFHLLSRLMSRGINK